MSTGESLTSAGASSGESGDDAVFYPCGEVSALLAQRVTSAAHAAFGVELADALIRPASPGRGSDYQCNVAMSLAKRLGKPSRGVASELLAALEISDLATEPSIGGPGFINITLRGSWLAQHVTALVTDPRLGAPLAEHSRRVIVDMSSPNIAKEMHVGHLRSTIIGDALVKILTFVGHDLVRQNHVGDWGTPFGMLLEHTLDLGWGGGGSPTARSIADLNAFYQQAREKFDSDPGFADRARTRVVLLQSGDAETLALWRSFVAESEHHFSAVYELLGVGLTQADIRGESFYNPMLPEIVRELEESGLATISDGALCVFPDGFTNKEGDPLPLIVRKRDGGYNYDTTDLACIKFRVTELKGDDLIYVVDNGQSLHFQMIFAAGRAAGWVPDRVRTQHVTFGIVLGEDGQRLRTRSGESVKLTGLLTEALARAEAVIAERQRANEASPRPSSLGGHVAPNMVNTAEQSHVARAVGIGAVKYADLSSDRNKDYVFNWDRALAMEGNTSVYLQYAYARIQSVLRRAATDEPLLAKAAAVRIDEPAEHALALALARFPAVVAATAQHLEPHRLCGYLYDLASAFSTFYENCPIIAAESPEVRASRLQLAAGTGRIIATGLGLLGIQTPERL